ncbi:MAG TPA: GspH/FimT family pseudopilin [Thermoanaerobaculia bacterium]
MMSKRFSAAERGYTLTEMLVVVAIVGILSLVAVPNFISMYRSSRLKTSMRQFTNDLRGARQRAVANYSMVRITFSPDAKPGSYEILESRDRGANWTTLSTRTMQNEVYFTSTNFTDTVAGDAKPDIVFDRDGTAVAPGGVGTIEVKSDLKIPVPKYTVSVRTTGKVAAQ